MKDGAGPLSSSCDSVLAPVTGLQPHKRKHTHTHTEHMSPSLTHTLILLYYTLVSAFLQK